MQNRKTNTPANTAPYKDRSLIKGVSVAGIVGAALPLIPAAVNKFRNAYKK